MIKKRIYNFLIVAFSLSIIIISLELSCRYLLNLGKPVIYEPNILWGYSPKPNQITERFKKSKITIDNNGTRSVYNWNNDKKKIIFFGDSVTYGGSYIDDEKIFSNLVCKNQENYSCFNAGVNAYGILNMTKRSRFDDRLEDSSIRIFVFINEDFFRGLQDKNTAHFFMRDLNKFFPGLHEIINFFFTKYNPKNFLSKKTKNYEISIIDKRKAILYGIEELSKEYKRLSNKGDRVYFYLSPNINEFKSKEINELSKLIIKIGKDFDIKINSLLPSMLSSNTEVEKIFYDRVHLEKDGHRILSESFIKDIIYK